MVPMVFFADSKEEWIKVISQLIDSPELRNRIGSSARITIEEKYSVAVNLEKLRSLLSELLTIPHR
jgi:glycosyltransferase involved in cell wall biosynthesis